jgi:hypothetical protein
MLLAGDQEVIDATARLARSGYVAILGQMLFIVGIMIYQVPPFELSRRPGAAAKAAARRVMRPASSRVPMFVGVGVAITVVALPLSYPGGQTYFQVFSHPSTPNTIGWTQSIHPKNKSRGSDLFSSRGSDLFSSLFPPVDPEHDRLDAVDSSEKQIGIRSDTLEKEGTVWTG